MLLDAQEVVLPFVGTVVACSAGIALVRALTKKAAVDTGGNVAEEMINRQGFNETQIPDDLDAVVIGSGMGGLTTAALLAKSGKKVLVLEQHYIAGGNCHTFVENGYEFDTGLHYIGGKVGTKGAFSPLRRLFEYVTDNGVEWEKMDKHYDIAVFGSGAEKEAFPMHEDIKTQIADMKAKFPDERTAIDKYYRYVRISQSQIPFHFVSMLFPRFLSTLLRPLGSSFLWIFQQTTLSLLSSITSNKKLIGVLTYVWGDYGEPPSTSAFGVQGLLVDHWKGGAFYPKGGPEVIPRRMIRVIEKAGGKVMVRAPVSHILVNDRGVAEGVCVKDVEVFARKVVSSVGAPLTFKQLVPAHVRHLVHEQLEGLHAPGMSSRVSLTSMFVGIKDAAGELQLPKSNLWRFPSYDHDANVTAFRNDPSQPFPGLFISFSSAKDPTYRQRHPGKQAALVIAPTCYEQVEAFKDQRCMHRDKQYQAIKDGLKERLLSALLEEFPQLRDRIDFVDIGTPVTNDFFLGNYRGACYGLAHTPERYKAQWLRPQTPIANLFLTGQDVLLCGIPSAMCTGLITAGAMDMRLFLTVGPQLLLRG